MLNEKLKSIRTSNHMTQEVLAKKIGVTRQTVSKWEKGYSVPDADILLKITDVFDISVSELLGTNDLSNKGDEQEIDNTNLAIILTTINEQLAMKNQQRKTIIRIIKIVLIVIALFNIIPILYAIFWGWVASGL